MGEALVFLNDAYLPLSQAQVPVLDRGFIFGDGVYEVIPVYGKQPFRLGQHLQRLNNSLEAVRIPNPYNETEWADIFARLLDENSFDSQDQSIYLQVTRGVAPRDHAFPKEITPTVFVMASALQPATPEWLEQGIHCITLDDIRWQYCRIKGTALLPNILLRQQALDQEASEAILIRDGHVTEGSASNIFVVEQGVIKTPPHGDQLLPGVTRDLVVELAQQHGLHCEEVEITETQLLSADEVWLTSSMKEVLPVTQLNQQPVGDGRPGPVWQQMWQLFQAYKQQLRQATQ